MLNGQKRMEERGKENVPARMQRPGNHSMFEKHVPEVQKSDVSWRQIWKTSV